MGLWGFCVGESCSHCRNPALLSGIWGFSDSILAERQLSWLPCTVLSCCGGRGAWPVWSVSAPRDWELHKSGGLVQDASGSAAP